MILNKSSKLALAVVITLSVATSSVQAGYVKRAGSFIVYSGITAGAILNGHMAWKSPLAADASKAAKLLRACQYAASVAAGVVGIKGAFAAAVGSCCEAEGDADLAE